MSYLSSLSLKNRSIVALAAVAIVAFGVYAATALKQELVPSTTLPAVTVTSAYQSASPELVDRKVTQIVESAVGSGEGLTDMTSYSSEGVSTIQLQYEYGTDIDATEQDLQQQVERIQSQLPEDVDPTVAAGSSEDLPVMTLAATSSGDEQRLAERLDGTIASEIEAVEGVNEVSVTGMRDRIVDVRLDPDRLEEEGLTTDAVTGALQSSGVAVPAGDVPAGEESLSVQVGDNFDSVGEIEDTYVTPTASSGMPVSTAASPESAVGTTPGGVGGTPRPGASPPDGAAQAQPAQPAAQEPSEPVRLGEVADVALALEESTSLTRTNGEPSLGLAITQARDGNTVDISDDVRAMILDLEDELGDRAELSIVTDNAPSIQKAINGTVTKGLIGLVLAVVVIVVFLLSVRSTLVTAVSIPLSVLTALISFLFFDYSLNLLTLSALTISIGRVVDDSIVVLENIKRHLEYGGERLAAITTAVREVAGAVTSSTLATVTVFLPIAFVGGITGELFTPFSVAVTVALLASLLVSLTVVPVLAYWFMGAPTGAERDEEGIRQEAEARERRNPLQRAYVPLIRWTTRHRTITLVAAFVVFAGSMSLVPRLETNFLADTGQNILSIEQELPPGSSLQTTDEAARKVEDVLEEAEGVESYQATVGSDGGEELAGLGGAAAGSNSASFTVVTGRNIDRGVVEQNLRERLDQLENAGSVTVSSADAATGSSNLEVQVQAADEDALREASNKVRDAVADTANTTDVSSDLSQSATDARVNVDGQAAAREGLTETSIGQAVLTADRGLVAAEADIGGETRDVYVQLGAEPDGVQELRELQITTPAGGTVELNEVADIEQTQAPTQITRIDGERATTITAIATTENTGAISAAMQQNLAQLDLPEGASYSLGGVTSDQGEAFTSLLIALLSAIVIVYMIMVGTFRSLLQPLALMVSVPFAATGVVVALLITGTPLGISVLIGTLMLVGIVVTNAIVLLDLIRQYRDRGMGTREAVVEGGRHRLRPILMTALATIGALLPMAVGLTASSGFISQPLAIAVIGGLTTSTILTLIIVPVLYTIVEDVKERLGKRRARRRSRRKLSKAERQELQQDLVVEENPRE